MSDLVLKAKLKANKWGFVLCPECGAELRGGGMEFFSGAIITVDHDGNLDYSAGEPESSELETLYCSMCSWRLSLFEDAVKVEVEKA